ncbi:hypothetical protein BROUX41_000221 [Berkeleyomyces rouxiae]
MSENSDHDSFDGTHEEIQQRLAFQSASEDNKLNSAQALHISSFYGRQTELLRVFKCLLTKVPRWKPIAPQETPVRSRATKALHTLTIASTFRSTRSYVKAKSGHRAGKALAISVNRVSCLGDS